MPGLSDYLGIFRSSEIRRVVTNLTVFETRLERYERYGDIFIVGGNSCEIIVFRLAHTHFDSLPSLPPRERKREKERGRKNLSINGAVNVEGKKKRARHAERAPREEEG